MKTYQFKTNLNCENCIAKVKSTLDANSQEWNVDLQNPDRILTIATEKPASAVMLDLIKDGFKATLVEAKN